jgi:hypothetical protein
LQRTAFTGQLSHHLLMFGLGLTLGVVSFASGGGEHRVCLRTRSRHHVIGGSFGGRQDPGGLLGA